MPNLLDYLEAIDNPREFETEMGTHGRKLLAALRAAEEWLSEMDHHEMLVDQDPNYPGYQTHVLVSILKAREAFRAKLAEVNK